MNQSEGDEKAFKKLWKEAAQHWEETKGLSNAAVLALEAFLEKHTKDIFNYIYLYLYFNFT